MVLEKDREDQLDRSCEKWRSIHWVKDRNILHTIKRRKANWIGHILRRNWLLIHIVEGKIEGRIDVTGRRGRRPKELLDGLKEKVGYLKLKEETPDRTVWKTGCGRSYGSVVFQTTGWITMYVCVYNACIFVCMYIHIYAYIYLRARARARARARTHTHTHMYQTHTWCIEWYGD